MTQKLYAGAKLREIRTRCGYTQKDFSGRLNISLPYYCQMENNKLFDICDIVRLAEMP